MMRLYCDMEFTGLRHDAEIISIAMYSQGNYFYAESNEFDRDSFSNFHKEHVIPGLKFEDCPSHYNVGFDGQKIICDSKDSLKQIKKTHHMLVKYDDGKIQC